VGPGPRPMGPIPARLTAYGPGDPAALLPGTQPVRWADTGRQDGGACGGRQLGWCPMTPHHDPAGLVDTGG
jgi:hypothetical protein